MGFFLFDGNETHLFGDTDDETLANDISTQVKEFSCSASFTTAASPRLGQVIAPQSVGSATGSGSVTFYASDGASELLQLLNAWTWDAIDANTTKPSAKYWFVEEPDGTAGSIRHIYAILPSEVGGPNNRAGQGGDQERPFNFVLKSYTKETIV